MADTYMCAHCSSTNLVHRMVDVQCMSCGNRTGRDGSKLPLEPTYPGGPTAHERRPM